MLNLNEARKELKIASELFDGPWIKHSESVANNAKLIAEHMEGMDPQQAYVMGLMHDIGRRNGATAILHTIDGYDYMNQMNQPAIAKICLTHSFPINDISLFSGKFDCTEQQKEDLKHYLENIEYDDYDRLIQLCDAISLPDGACIMEKRLVDVALRHGFKETTLEKWKAFLNLKKYFDRKCGCDIYTFLPNVIENSYRSLI